MALTAIVPMAAGATPQRSELGPSTSRAPSTVLQDDCAGGEIYDDGTRENGYTGIGDTTFDAVQRFTPAAYPTRYTTVCIPLVSLSEPTLTFEVRIWDDDGAGGTPGTLLRAYPTSASGIAAALPCSWHPIPVTSPALTIKSGSVFIGLRWNSAAQPNRYICVDESVETPLHPGYINKSLAGWVPTQNQFPNYRAFAIRAERKIVKRVRLRAFPGAVEPGQLVELVARVKPCVQGDRHVIGLQEKKGAWKNVARKRTTGACKATFRRKVGKTTRFRAFTPGNMEYFPARSRPVKVRVV